jgi:DNA polymerase-3 subunit beta
MKLTMMRESLIEAIQHVSKALSSRTTIPILTGIKFEANENGLVLTASDTDITIQSFIPIVHDKHTVIELEQKGSVVLPSKIFIEMIRKLSTSKINIEVKENFETMIISGSSIIQIMGLDPEDYPAVTAMANNEKTLSIPSDLLKLIIKQTTFAVSANEATPILTGVMWNIQKEESTFISCDRHRLAKKKINLQLSIEKEYPQIVISGKTLNELNKILPDNHTNIDILIEDNLILFKINEVHFYSGLLNGSYPDTSKLIPQSFESQISIQTKQLIDSIERAYLLSREDKNNIVKLNMLENNTFEITSSSQSFGKIKEELTPTSMSGQLLKISFNSKYMLEALKVIESEILHMSFTGTMQPIIIKPENDDEMIQLILPYRTTN